MTNKPLSRNVAQRLALSALAAVLMLAGSDVLLAGDYYDAQGADIVDVLRRDFPIPVDGMSHPTPVKGVYWQPYTYWSWGSFSPVHSSEIVIYGVKDRAVQDAIFQRITALKQRRVLVTFYDDSRFTARYDQKGNGGSSRLPTPKLRQELLQ